LKEYPLMLITWQDHSGSAGWSDLETERKAEIVVAQTIGWLVHKDRWKYHIADTLLEDGFGGVSQIMRKLITSEHEIDLK